MLVEETAKGRLDAEGRRNTGVPQMAERVLPGRSNGQATGTVAVSEPLH